MPDEAWAPETAPLVLAAEGRHGPVIHDMNAAAMRLGLRSGARVTDTRALVPDLRVEAADPAGEARDLAMLAQWCRRWCPWTQIDAPRGLMLETTGSDHLSGGEAAMLTAIMRSLAAAGWTARLAAAPTIGAAWALARYTRARTQICAPENLRARLAPLPVRALRLEAGSVTLLARLGLKTIGALDALPRTALARRFTRPPTPFADPVLRLDQAMGRLAEPLMPGHPREPLRAVRRLAEPVTETSGVAHLLEALSDDLSREMEAAGCGARRLRLTGYRVDGAISQLEVSVSRGSRDPHHLAKLFESRLDRLDAGFGFDAIALEAVRHEPLDALQPALGAGAAPARDGNAAEAVELARLIDRLVARLGPDAIRRPRPQGSHLPERAEILAPVGETAAETALRPRTAAPPTDGPARPLRLLARPEEASVVYGVPDGPPARFVWRRQSHAVTRSEGPERIAPEWWREPGRARLRDYYHVEDSAGRRFWLYREGLAQDGRGEAPRWFVHGIFA